MSSLAYIPQLDYSSANLMPNAFYYCRNLRHISLKGTHAITNYATAFNTCTLLARIDGIDFSSATKADSIFYGCTALVFVNAVNIGKSTLTTYNFSGATVWGAGSDENRQSLIDSLITYSYDRASNGLPTATIQLSANTKALLTDDEIAQITQKGYTIA